ncbi:unnamed protein product, partial [Closterium sp. NIES-53]
SRPFVVVDSVALLHIACDSRDGLSLFDLTSGASTAPAADADSTVRLQWLTRDAVARLAVCSHLPPTERAHFSQYKCAKTLYDAVVARYSSPATAALSRLMLSYLFRDLAAFATVTDIITHLRTSDTRYRAALPAEFCAQNPPPMYFTLYYLVTRLPDTLRSVRDHFLSLCPTTLTVDLLEERLLAAKTSITAVGASRGDPRTPFFEGCSPFPLLPSVASDAAVDFVGTESVSAASAPSERRRISKAKRGKGAGGGSGGSSSGEAPLQTLHMDVWGPARVRGQGHERYFLLVVDDYSRYTTVFPLRSKGAVTKLLIDWIRAARLQLRERFGSDFLVLRLHSDTGGELSSDILRAFCRAEGIRQTFTLPASPQQNGIAERHIGMDMDVARTSMIHVASPHFLWPFAVQYAAHQINLQPRVSLPETSPTLRWTGKVGDASAFRVWGSRAFVRDLSADKLSSRAIPCVFLGFPPDAPGWQFYHPSSRRVLSSQDVTFDESVSYYRLFPYRTAPLPPPPLFLVPGPPPVDPLPPQGPAPLGVSQVDAVEPVEVAANSGASRGAEPGGAEPGGAGSGGAEPERAEPGGAASGGAEPGAAESEGVEPAGPGPGGPSGALSRRELPSPQELREWFARRWSHAAGAGGAASAGGSAATGAGGATGAGTGGSPSTRGAGATGPGGARTKGTRAARPAGAPGARAGGAAGVGATSGTGA